VRIDAGMGMEAGRIRAELRSIIDAALRGVLTEAMADRAVAMGPEASRAVMLAASARIAELKGRGPHTPSGAVPPHAKARGGRGRRGRPGARKGHEGRRRPPPARIDRHERVEDLKSCPNCEGPVGPATGAPRTRIVEDMPEDTRVEATEYQIPRHWCANCKTHVEPRVGAALPKANIGNRLVALSTVFHYGLGLTIEQTRDVLLSPLQTGVSAGGLVDIWRRAAGALLPWYEQIMHEARRSAVLHADETGWRVNGDTHWLWCFCNHRSCGYLVDRSRGGPALKKFFTEAFEGVLIHDFWSPYASVLLKGGGDHQCCLAHLLRELDHVDEHRLPHKPPDGAREWAGFVKTLRRLLRDGIRLRRREDFTPEKYSSRIARIDARLSALARAEYADPDASRLAARLRRHQDELFTFLDRPEADWNNNFAERQIRPAVVLRKNSQCNRSERGAATQAVLMSVYRTLKLRGHDPRQAIADALNAYAATGRLPPLPGPATGDG
jgi:transposase